MNWILRSASVLGSLTAFLLLIGGDSNEVLGQGKGGKGKGKGNPVQAYQHSLDHAMKKLKEAEKAVLAADTRELNLQQFSPAHFQRMTQALQLINQAYVLCNECKTNPPPHPMKGKGKGKGKGK